MKLFTKYFLLLLTFITVVQANIPSLTSLHDLRSSEYGVRYYDPRTSVWQSPDPIIGEYMSGETNGGVFNPKNLGLFTYSYNDPVNLVDPDGNNPGPIYLEGPIAKVDFKSGNQIADNTLLGAVNTFVNTVNSFANAGLNALNAYGEAIEPHEGAINSVASGVGPYGKALGMAVIGSAKGAQLVGTLGKASNIWTSTKKKTAVENAFGHWKKHGSEFPKILNAKQYVEETKNFMKNPPKGTLSKTRSDGDVVRYHDESNTFGVMTKDGVPRTMFKPDPSEHGYKTNLEYFNAQ